MSQDTYILVAQLCTHYAVEQSFFYSLKEHDLIEIISIESKDYVHREHLPKFEKMLRISQDLDLGIEGLDVVIDLLSKIELLQKELTLVKNRLAFYEE